MVYFFNMMTSNSNASLINYGDVFRIKKYNLVFRNWDFTDNIQTFMVYPEQLTKAQMTVLPTVMFLREKEIVKEMQSVYQMNKALDHV